MTAYSTRHWRVRKVRGPAKQFPCTHCSERQALDWALLHGQDGEDPQSYIPLCRKCHIRYDGSGHHSPHTDETKALLSQKNSTYKHTPEAVEKIRAASAARRHTAASLAKMSRQRKAAAAARGPMPAEQRAKISAALRGNANATGNSGELGSRRTGQALENIRLGQQRRRERERAQKDAEKG